MIELKEMLELVVVLCVIVYIWNGVYIVPTGFKAIVTMFGVVKETSRIFEPGLNFAPYPWGLYLVNVRQQLQKLDTLEVLTHDMVKIKVEGSLIFRISNIFTFLHVQPGSITQGLDDIWDETIRHAVSSEDLNDVLSMGTLLQNTTQDKIGTTASKSWGIEVIRVNIAGIIPVDEEVTKDLEEKRREVAQTEAEQVQAQHFANLVNFLCGTKKITKDGPRGPGLPQVIAVEIALSVTKKSKPKKYEHKTFGLDPGFSELIQAALKEVMKEK